jgi:gliding motility-associated-like protein
MQLGKAVSIPMVGIKKSTIIGKSILKSFSMVRKPFINYYIKALIVLTVIIMNYYTALSQNLITNGSFSNNSVGWVYFAPGTATEAYLPETSYGGTNNTNIVAEIDNQCNLRQINIPVTSGAAHWFSFRRTRRTLGGAPSSTIIKLKIYDGTTTYIDQNYTSNNTSWNMQCEVLQFIPTSTMVTVEFANVAASTLGTIIDDITMTPITQPIVLNGYTCQGGTITLQAPFEANNPNTNYSNYSWIGPNGFNSSNSSITFNNVQPDNNGQYICSMTLNHCLTVTGIYNLDIAPNSFVRNDSICKGETYYFYGKGLTETGTYDTLITSSSSNICDSVIELNLKVIEQPFNSIGPSLDVTLCDGDMTVLYAAPIENDVHYQWYRNNEIINGEQGGSYTATESGQYHYQADRHNCNSTSNVVEVLVNPAPLAQIQTLPELICAYDTFRLKALKFDNSTYIWEPKSVFGALENEEEEQASILGLYTQKNTLVKMTIVNEYGCFNTDSIYVLTQPCCDMFLPNAFSPNADGVNDYFLALTEQGQWITTMDVYDRWGGLVYRRQHNDKGWDGKYPDGRIANVGTYMYFIRYNCTDSKTYFKKGEVILIR